VRQGYEHIVTPPCHPGYMNDQLPLLDDTPARRPDGWRLDAKTREIGLRGVASAREALRASACRAPGGDAAARAA
jgi:hypothetical protein